MRAYSSSISNNFLWSESSGSTLKLVLWPPPSDSESEYNNIPDAEPSRCFGGEPTHGESGVGAVFFFALWAHRIDNFGALADITELRVRVRDRVRVRLRRWIINRKAQSIMLLWWGATVGNAWASCIL